MMTIMRMRGAILTIAYYISKHLISIKLPIYSRYSLKTEDQVFIEPHKHGG